MGRYTALFFAAAVLFAAEDSWTKVKELKSGTEIRIVRKGVPQPLEAKLDEVRDDAIVIVVKKEQKAVPREEIERLDYRPKPGSRTTTETRTKSEPVDGVPPAGMDHGAAVPGQSQSTSVSIGS